MQPQEHKNYFPHSDDRSTLDLQPLGMQTHKINKLIHPVLLVPVFIDTDISANRLKALIFVPPTLLVHVFIKTDTF